MQLHEMASAFKSSPAGARLRWATVSAVGDRTVDIAIAGSATVVPGVPRVGAYYPVVGDTVAVIVSGMDMLVLGMMEGGPGTGIVPASKLPTGVGQYTSYIFIRFATQPATPTGPDPTTWSDSPPTENGNPLWMSLATIALDGTLVGTWSTPVQIEGSAGAPGAPGADGASVSVEYSLDGSTSWHSIFNPSADIYMHLKVGSGAWSAAMRIVGEQGAQGPAGAPGAAASISTQYSVDGATNWHSTFNAAADLYMEVQIGIGGWSGPMRVVGAAGAPGSTGATGSQGIQGPAGSQGTPGTQGIPGPAGANGATTYTWIKYGTSAAGASLQDSPTGMTYMGIAYNKLTPTESTTPSDYSWSLIQGAAGAAGSAGSTGSQGIQGPAGSNGAPTYTWIKYGSNSSGAGISDSPIGMTYMGIAYNKLTQTESVTPSDYTWSLIQGAAGAQGSQGSQGIQGIQGPQGPAGGLQTQVFFVAPTTPWNIGDMYWDGTGIMRRCIQARGGSYTFAQYPGDWANYSIKADYISAGVAMSAPTITGGTMSAPTITGGTFQTAASGERMVITGASLGQITYYPPSGATGAIQWTQGTADVMQMFTSQKAGLTKAGFMLVSGAGGASHPYMDVNCDLDVDAVYTTALGGILTVGGATTLTGLLTPNGGIAGHTVSGALAVTGAATVGTTLGVTGVLTPSGGIAAHSVTGLLSATAGIAVTGILDLSGSVSGNYIQLRYSNTGPSLYQLSVNASGHLQARTSTNGGSTWGSWSTTL
jgi:hypothetical protein